MSETTLEISARAADATCEKLFSCMVCNHPQSQSVLADCKDLYLQKPYRVDYRRCTGCGLVQQHPLPLDVAPFYDAYPIHQRQSKLYSAFRRLLMSPVYLPPTHWPRGSMLLDLGCGDGWYLEWCVEHGLKPVGFEPNAAHARALSARLGLPVMSDAQQLRERYAGRFDVITLHFVVEHLTDLHATFALAAALLKPGGVMRYVVPNIASWEYSLFRKRWHSLDPPRHISFPDLRHAKLMADRVGLVVESEQAVAFPNGFGGSLPTALLKRFSAPVFLATLPISVLITRLFPSGNVAYRIRRPQERNPGNDFGAADDARLEKEMVSPRAIAAAQRQAQDA